MIRSVLKSCAVFAAWAVVHSLLATHKSKNAALAVIGERKRNAFYRVGYNAFAIVTFTAVFVYIHRLPDRPLYRISGGSRALVQVTRLALLVYAITAAVEIGLGPFSGLSEVVAELSRQRVNAEPEAQGPVLAANGLRTGGPFAISRHPLNFSAAAIVALNPDMTVVRLTVAAITWAYAYLGSIREEQRLLTSYGEPYLKYRESGVPFFLPTLPRIVSALTD